MRSRKANMLAAVLAAPGQVEITRVPLPSPGPNEVRVRLEGCGICGSNQPVWEGRPWFEYPLAPGAPGHEGWGWIDAVGDEVTGWSVGDRAGVLSYRAFAEFDLAPSDALVRLPPELDGCHFPAEPLGCAFNVFRRSAIEPGQTVAVIGIGFLGALIAALAVRKGARVLAVSRRPFALDLARQFGASEVISLEDDQRAIDRVREATGGAGCERVIEAVGHQRTLDLAGEITCERGRLIVAGYHQDGLRQVNMQLWNWRGIDVINAHERSPAVYIEGMRHAVEAVANGDLDPSPLYTHRATLTELNSAMEMMRTRPDRFMKALVML